MNSSTQASSKGSSRILWFKSWKVIGALVLVASLVTTSTALAMQSTAADSSRDGGNAQVIFTKWVTTEGDGQPVKFHMEGVVSGDVGGGQFVGEILEILEQTPTEANTTIKALYHLNGGAQQLTAQLTVVQDNNAGTAVLKGVVTDGWMKGAKVRGAYQVIAPCGILNVATDLSGDVCFQGTLRIQGHGHH
jgi:hypothetical protein